MLKMKSVEKQITCSTATRCSPNTTTKSSTMEDVWNGITTTPHSFPATGAVAATAATTRSVFYDLNLHDLLDRPDPPPPPTSSTLAPISISSTQDHHHYNKTPLHQQINATSQTIRYKRMVKNRESAARSRARKQAYTYELELEVAHLQKENAKLRRLLENKFSLVKTKEAPSAGLPKKQSLHRTLTAPF